MRKGLTKDTVLSKVKKLDVSQNQGILFKALHYVKQIRAVLFVYFLVFSQVLLLLNALTELLSNPQVSQYTCYFLKFFLLEEKIKKNYCDV